MALSSPLYVPFQTSGEKKASALPNLINESDFTAQYSVTDLGDGTVIVGLNAHNFNGVKYNLTIPQHKIIFDKLEST